MSDDLQGNLLVFAGPFLGEFGWELSHWIPHVRWLKETQYKHNHLVVASYPDRKCLYRGIVDRFIPLPDWFLKEEYDCDCFEALAPSDVYGKLIEYFRTQYKKSPFSKFIETRTPRGFNHILREQNHVRFRPFYPSLEAEKICQEFIGSHNNKPLVIIFAREVFRKMFLEINRNTPEDCSKLPDLPTRNWPRSHWEFLFDLLYEKYGEEITFVIGGTRKGNCLDNIEKEGVISLIDINSKFPSVDGLDITIAFLRNSILSISSQSAPTHLSLQCNCPSFVYGHELHRHVNADNPFKTPVTFLETKITHYNHPPRALFRDISREIESLLEYPYREETTESVVPTKDNDKMFIEAPPFQSPMIQEPPMVVEEPRDYKVGVVGVLDVEGSTNIPFAGAIQDLGYDLSGHNYRTTAKKKGVDFMNMEIVDFSKHVDFMIFCKCSGVALGTIMQCSKQCVTCWYMMDALHHLEQYPDFYKFAEICDMSVVTTRAVYDELIKSGIKEDKIEHIIQGVDPEEFYPIDCEKVNDVCFIGSQSVKRTNILMKLKEHFKVEAFGHGYPNGVVKGEEFNRACCSSKVCLAINNTDPALDSFSDRMLRYMATKSCVVAEYSKGLENYFTNGKELFWWDQGSDLVSIIKDAMERSEEVAQAGYEKVLQKHTWSKVAEQIMEKALNLISREGK